MYVVFYRKDTEKEMLALARKYPDPFGRGKSFLF